VIKIVIQGPPIVQERPRKGRYGNFYDPSSKAKQRLSYELLVERHKMQRKPLTENVALEVVFYGLKKGDIDNAIKALLDAGNKILWEDDKQIVAIEAHVVRTDNHPRTVLCLKEI